MKRFFALCGGSLLVVLLLAVAVRAEEIKNQYFTLDLPLNWHVEMSQKIAETMVVIATDTRRNNFVGITVIGLKKPSSAKEVCTMICNELKAGGVHVGEPVASGESYVVEYSNGEKNVFHYFTSTGKMASSVYFIGDDGKKVLQTYFKPVDPKLFPASY